MSAINVNLRPCTCIKNVKGAPCVATCPSVPILIPCPIQRSVTLEVVLGGCVCWKVQVWANGRPPCPAFCPARPVRVSCSISGKTWEESEVEDPEGHGTDGRLVGFVFGSHVHVACRERWALVKALVTGQHVGLPPALAGLRPDIQNLFLQRDAVCTRLASMRRHEEALYAEWLTLPDSVKRRCGVEPYNLECERTPAQEALECYVAGLIEQVGVL
jgi:hypothetical protein